jgi:hypothetical protein
MMDLQKMMEIILNEVKKNNITIKKWNKKSHGKSEEGRLVEIPIPKSSYSIGVCFHEIGHIVLKHFDTEVRKLRYIEEYEAEQYAIKKLKEYGYYNKKYKYRAIQYVLSEIAQIKNRKKHDIKDIPKEIVEWTNLDVDKWSKAKRVHVEMFNNVKRKKDIKIKFKK